MSAQPRLTRRLAMTVLGASLVAAPACNAIVGNDSWTLVAGDGGADGADASKRDSQLEAANDGTPPLDGPGDTETIDAPNDTPTDHGPPDSGLSPQLVLPPSGTACDPAEGDGDCPDGETCRISSATGGTCDSFTSCEGHEAGYPCTVDSDCDDTLQCYKGECFALCPLGMNCAGGCECFSVGNDDTGLCCPGMP
jgi:hypothetical protein